MTRQLTEGEHNFTLECWEEDLGIVNYTTRVFSISIPPEISVIEPGNGTFFSNFTLNISTNENASSCWYNLNGTENITLENKTKRIWNTTIKIVNESVYDLKVYCNDSHGNTGTNASIVFTYNTPPRIRDVTASPKITNKSVTILHENAKMNKSKI